MELDLSSLRSVRKFAAAWRQRRLPLQCLINNAGVFAMGGARELTPDGYEAHLGTNHLGHFLLTMLLLPGLQQAAEEVSCNASRQCSLPSAARLWRVLWSFAANSASVACARCRSAALPSSSAATASCSLQQHAPSSAFSTPLLLLPLAAQTGRPGRVVHVSSKLHFMGSLRQQDMNLSTGYTSLAAYGQSKLAQVGVFLL